MGIEIPKKPAPQFKTRVLPVPPPIVKGQVGAAVGAGVVKIGKQIIQAVDQLDRKLTKAEATTQANQAYRQSVVAFDQFIRDLDRDTEWETFEQRFEQRAEEIYARQAEGISIQEGQREFTELFQNERVRRLLQTKDKRRQKQLGYLQAELQLDVEMGIDWAAQTGDENYLKYRVERAVEDGVVTAAEGKKFLTAAEDAVDWKKEWNLVSIMPYEAGMKYLLDNSKEHFLEDEKRRIAMADQLRHKHGLQVENNNREKRTAIAEATNTLMDRFIDGKVPDYAEVAGIFNKISTNDPDVVSQKFTWLNRLEARNAELEKREKAEGKERIAEEKSKKEDRREGERIDLLDKLDDGALADYDAVRAEYKDLNSADLQFVQRYFAGEQKGGDSESVTAVAAQKIQSLERLPDAQIDPADIDKVEAWINDKHGKGLSTKTMRTYWGDLNALRKRKRDFLKPNAEKDPNLLTDWNLYEESLNMEDDVNITLEKHLEWLNDHAGVNKKGGIQIGMKDVATLKNRAKAARRDETMKEVYALLDDFYRNKKADAWNADEKVKLDRERMEKKKDLSEGVAAEEANKGRKLTESEKLDIYDNAMKPEKRNKALEGMWNWLDKRAGLGGLIETQGERIERLFYEGKTFGMEEHYDQEFGDLREGSAKDAEEEFKSKRGDFAASYIHPKFWLPIIEKVKGSEYYVKIQGEWFSLDVNTMTPNKIKL